MAALVTLWMRTAAGPLTGVVEGDGRTGEITQLRVTSPAAFPGRVIVEQRGMEHEIVFRLVAGENVIRVKPGLFIGEAAPDWSVRLG